MASQVWDGSNEPSKISASAEQQPRKLNLAAIIAEQPGATRSPGSEEKSPSLLPTSKPSPLVLPVQVESSPQQARPLPGHLDFSPHGNSSLDGAGQPTPSIKQPGEKKEQSLAQLASSLNSLQGGILIGSSEQAEASIRTRQTVSDLAGTMAASVTGVAAFSLSVVFLKTRLATLPLAAAAGSVVELGVKSGAEHLLLEAKDRTAGPKDLLYGALDAVAGVAGGWAEKKRSLVVLEKMGRDALGNVSTGTAIQAGKDLVHDSAASAIWHSANRGFAGGFAASALWSAPRRIDENLDTFKVSPAAAATNVATGVIFDTAIGASTGGTLGAFGSTVMRSNELINKAIAKFRNPNDLTWVDLYSVNDLHSNIDQLPRLKTLVDDLIDKSHAKGRTAVFVVAGDPISGHVNFAFTKEGRVEYRALAEVGRKADVTVVGLGNHEYDAAGGRFDPDRYPSIIGPILSDNPNMHLINANLDVSSINGFKELIERTHTLPLRGTADTLGLTAVTTEEGAIGGIKYNDALASARTAIDEVKAKGADYVQLTTHIGAKEDEDLARGLLASGHKVIMSNGGHSHTVLPRLRWFSNKETLLDKMQFWKPTQWIPNQQAGHSGRWLSASEIAIRPDGSPDRWLSKGRLIPIDDSIKENAAMRTSLDAEAQEVKALKEIKYNAHATENYSLRGTRLQETPLGNLYADATLKGLKARAGVEADISMVHSGGIRADLYAGHEITRLDLANVVMNAGRLEGEQQELTLVSMKGSQIKAGLEYSLRDMSAPSSPSVAQRMQTLLGLSPSGHEFDPAGNLMQVSGMRYRFDLRNPVGQRITRMEVANAEGRAPILPDQEYKVVTRFHPLDKWHAAGVFGDVSLQEAYENLKFKPLPVSQVDLLGDYIQGKSLDPNEFSAVEGRIKNKTPQPGQIPIKLGTYQTGIAAVSAADPRQ